MCVITFHLQGDVVFSNQPTLLHVYPETLLSRQAALPQSPPEGSHTCVEGTSCPLGLYKQLSNWVTFLRGCPCLSYVPIWGQSWPYHRKQAVIVPQNKTLKYMKQKLREMTGELDNSKITVETSIPHFP